MKRTILHIALSLAAIFAACLDSHASVSDFAREVCRMSETDTIAVIPPGVTEIPDYAFYCMPQLRQIDIPQSVKKIGRYAFAWGENLDKVTLPSRLEDIGAHAFAYCSSLREINFPSTLRHIGNNAFSRCSSLTEVSLPSGITELESYAFSDCVSLLRATLPANRSLLGELIFSGCTSLRDLTCMSPVPPEFDCRSFIFEPDETGLYRQCRLHVPGKSEDAYRSAHGWNLFFQAKAKQ